MKIEPVVKKQWTPVTVTFETEEEFVTVLVAIGMTKHDNRCAFAKEKGWPYEKEFMADHQIYSDLLDYYEEVKS